MNVRKILGIVAGASGAALLVLGAFVAMPAAMRGFSGVSLAPTGVTHPMGMQAMGGGMSASSGVNGMTGMTGMGMGSSMGMRMMGSRGMGTDMMGTGHMYGWGGTSTTSSAVIAGAPEVRVTAGEFTLSPAEIVLPAGGPVNLTLENRGALPHDLTIPALSVRVIAAGGQTQTVGLRDLPAGTYTAYCSIPGHADAGMRATVIVR